MSAPLSPLSVTDAEIGRVTDKPDHEVFRERMDACDAASEAAEEAGDTCTAEIAHRQGRRWERLWHATRPKPVAFDMAAFAAAALGLPSSKQKAAA